MQCVNQLKDPTQILLSAVEKEIITKETLKTICDGDLEKQKEAMERLTLRESLICLFILEKNSIFNSIYIQ